MTETENPKTLNLLGVPSHGVLSNKLLKLNLLGVIMASAEVSKTLNSLGVPSRRCILEQPSGTEFTGRYFGVNEYSQHPELDGRT